MSLQSEIQSLVDFITVKRTYEEVEAEAFRINPCWRSETWRRSLRRRKDVKAIGKDGTEPNGNNPIVYYEPTTPVLSPHKPASEALTLNTRNALKENTQGELFKMSIPLN